MQIRSGDTAPSASALWRWASTVAGRAHQRGSQGRPRAGRRHDPRAMTLTLPPLEPWTRPREAVRLLLSGATARMCLPVALVVGTVLSLLNHGDVVVQGAASGAVVVKVLANYAIPFLSSSTGALMAVRRRPAADGRR